MGSRAALAPTPASASRRPRCFPSGRRVPPARASIRVLAGGYQLRRAAAGVRAGLFCGGRWWAAAFFASPRWVRSKDGARGPVAIFLHLDPLPLSPRGSERRGAVWTGRQRPGGRGGRA